MKIYKVAFYSLVDNKFFEHYHKNFQHIEDAKEYVKEHIQESERILKDNNFHIMEYNYKEDNRHYLVDMNYDGYYNEVIRERLEIVEEQVY